MEETDSEREDEISDQEENKSNNFNINIDEERKYWRVYLIKNFIYIPNECPQCKKQKITIGIGNKLLNPLRLVCNNSKCFYRTNLRKFSFLKCFQLLPASELMKILFKFIIDERNGDQILKYLISSENIKISKPTILKILTWFRRAFAHYLKDIYRLYKLGKTEGGSMISVDESYFVKQNGTKIWVLGAKNNKTSKIRLDIFKSRTETDCKTFITNHINEQNTIITDGWVSYQFLDDPNSNYVHEIHRHGPGGNFGFGVHSTSFIEGAWGTVKQYIKKIYNYIPDENFILFLREAEFRFNIGQLNNSEKEEKIIEVFQYLYNSSAYELYDDDELNDNNNYVC